MAKNPHLQRWKKEIKKPPTVEVPKKAESVVEPKKEKKPKVKKVLEQKPADPKPSIPKKPSVDDIFAELKSNLAHLNDSIDKAYENGFEVEADIRRENPGGLATGVELIVKYSQNFGIIDFEEDFRG